MQNDIKDASTNPLLETLCYDVEKVFSLPKVPTNLVYYKHKLSITNEGIYGGSTNKPNAFSFGRKVWPTEAHKKLGPT